MNEKVLMTAGRDRERIPASGKSGGFLSVHQLVDGQLHLSDMDYCVRFGEPKEWAGMRKEVEERRSKIPAFSFWTCPKCAWKMQAAGDKQEGGACLSCNFAHYKDGAFMRRMSEAEVQKYQEDQRADMKQGNEQLFMMALDRDNEDRKKHGLPEFSIEQYRLVYAGEQKLKNAIPPIRPKAQP